MQIINMLSMNNLYTANVSPNVSSTLSDALGIPGDLLSIMMVVFVTAMILAVVAGVAKGINKRESKRILGSDKKWRSFDHEDKLQEVSPEQFDEIDNKLSDISNAISPRSLVKDLNNKFVKDLYKIDESLDNKKGEKDERSLKEESDKYKQWR